MIIEYELLENIGWCFRQFEYPVLQKFTGFTTIQKNMEIIENHVW